MTLRKHRYPIVEVIWDDAEGDAGWQDPPDELHPTLVRQIGFLVKETPKYVFLAAAYIDSKEDKQISSTDKIPKGMIQDIRHLTVRVKKPKQKEDPK